MIAITLLDETKVNYKKKKLTPKDIAEDIGVGLAKAALAAKVNGKLVDLSYQIKEDSEVEIITFDNDAGKEVFRHSSAHLLAAAVQNLFPKVKFGIGPAVEEGFYYDFDKKEPFTPEDLEKIEKEMEKLVKKDISFKREEISKAKAKKLFKDQPYKLELLKEIKKPVIYKLGDFTDLCSGPHVPSSGKVKAFKLTKTAGAYWKGDSDNKQLQRIYGISFPDKKQLKKHLKLQKEAEKRDHRKIGKRMELFSIHEQAPGMPFFHNNGTFIFERLKDYMTKEMRALNYEINKTPIILNKSLWLKSGHWDHYKDNMYFTKIDDKDFAVKPMNCPGNILIFKTKLHSYKELPIKAI